MPDTPPPQPDSKRLFDVLLSMNMDPGSAYTFIQAGGREHGRSQPHRPVRVQA